MEIISKEMEMIVYLKDMGFTNVESQSPNFYQMKSKKSNMRIYSAYVDNSGCNFHTHYGNTLEKKKTYWFATVSPKSARNAIKISLEWNGDKAEEKPAPSGIDYQSNPLFTETMKLQETISEAGGNPLDYDYFYCARGTNLLGSFTDTTNGHNIIAVYSAQG